MILPTWLYSKDGKSSIVNNEEDYNKKVNDGWKDSPAKFKEEQPKPVTHTAKGAKK